MDLTLVDKTGPVMVTLWDDAVGQFQNLMKNNKVQNGGEMCVSIEVLRISQLQKSEWNGKILTPMHAIHSVSALPNRRGTQLAMPKFPSSPYLLQARYVAPASPMCLEVFQPRRKELVAPFRATVKGAVANVLTLDISQGGNAKRLFDIVDQQGTWFKCCALGSVAQSTSLKDGFEVVLYHGLGRSPVGSTPGMLYLMKDAVIVAFNRRDGEVVKRTQIEIE